MVCLGILKINTARRDPYKDAHGAVIERNYMTYNPENYIALAKKVAMAFIKKNPAAAEFANDIEQESYVAMLEGLVDYDPKRTSRSLTVFLTFRCHQGILNYCVRYEYRGYKVLKLEDAVSVTQDDGAVICWEEILPGDILDIPGIIAKFPEQAREDTEIFVQGGTREQQRIKMGRVSHEEFTTRRKAVRSAIAEGVEKML